MRRFSRSAYLSRNTVAIMWMSEGGKPPVSLIPPHSVAHTTHTRMNQNKSLNSSPGRETLQPSLSGRVQESVYEISGVIWIKLPAGTRGNSLRAWSRKFTSIRSELFLQPDAVHLCAVLLIHRSEKPDSEITLKKRLTSQNTLIFRSK